MKILIVDDNQFARELIKDYLNLNNVNVEIDESDNGQDAQAKVENTSYDLILLDISMPGVNGLEVLKTIRKFDKNVKVIITSVVSTDYQKERAFKEGADEYLAKPIEMSQLVDWINELKVSDD